MSWVYSKDTSLPESWMSIVVAEYDGVMRPHIIASPELTVDDRVEVLKELVDWVLDEANQPADPRWERELIRDS